MHGFRLIARGAIAVAILRAAGDTGYMYGAMAGVADPKPAISI